MHGTTLKDLDICQRMIPLRMLTPNKLDLLFQGKYFKIYYLGNGEIAQHVK